MIPIELISHFGSQQAPLAYTENFPQFVDFKEIDAIAHESFFERFIQAHEAGLPYYLIDIIELRNQTDTTIYRIYDGTLLWQYQKAAKKSTCPTTNLKIINHHYFVCNTDGQESQYEKITALFTCMDMAKEQDIYMSALNQFNILCKLEKLSFKYFDPSIYHREGNPNFALTALQIPTNETEKNTVKRVQILVAAEITRIINCYIKAKNILECNIIFEQKATKANIEPIIKDYNHKIECALVEKNKWAGL